MCRFNLVMIKTDRAKEVLCDRGYDKWNEGVEGYTSFIKGYCNCDSFVGSLCEQKGVDYETAINQVKKKSLDGLYKMRDFMKQPGYEEARKAFRAQHDAFANKLMQFYEAVGDYEEAQNKILEATYQGGELDKMKRNLQKDVERKFREVDLDPEYMSCRRAYDEFLQENEMMDRSTRYFLTKEEEQLHRKASNSPGELIQVEDKGQIATTEYTDTSQVIDEVILKEEQHNFMENKDEFAEYKALFDKLFLYEENVLFATIWSEAHDLKLVKSVEMNDLRIDDMAFLEFDEMIEVKRPF